MMEPGMAPHRPSRLGFAPNLQCAQYRALRLPPRLPATEVVGPGWEADFRKADRLSARAKQLVADGDRSRATVVLELAFKEFAKGAEDELIAATGLCTERKGLLGRKPSFVWTDVIPKQVKDDRHYLTSRQQEEADLWQWLVTRGRELRTLAARSFSCGDDLVDGDELFKFISVEDLGVIPGEGGWTAADAGYELDRHLRCATDILKGQRSGTIRGASLADTLACRGRPGGAGFDDDEEDEILVAQQVADWFLMFDESARDGADPLDEAQSIAGKQASRGWEEWVESALQRSCRAAHRWAKAPLEQKPDRIVYIDGVAFSDPMKLIEEECERFCSSGGRTTPRWTARFGRWST